MFITYFVAVLKHESKSPEFVWGFQCSLLRSKIHHLGQEKSNSLPRSTQAVNIHYLDQIHNLGQNIYTINLPAIEANRESLMINIEDLFKQNFITVNILNLLSSKFVGRLYRT